MGKEREREREEVRKRLHGWREKGEMKGEVPAIKRNKWGVAFETRKSV